MTPDRTTTTAPTSSTPSAAGGARGMVDPDVQGRGTTVITKHFNFEAAHFLPNVADDHKCRRVHGHSYQVWIHVAGRMDAEAGWIVDFGDIKQVWKELEHQLDHRLLNDVGRLENPTAENVAAWVWLQFERRRLEGNCQFRVAAVEMAETADSRALFVAPSVGPWVPGHQHVTLPQGWDPEADLDGAMTTTQPAIAPKGSVEADGHREMPDVQSQHDDRGLAIDDVGVSDVRLPIVLHDRTNGRQATVASVTLSVGLAADQKGAHLSRFLQVVRDRPDGFTLLALGSMTEALRDTLGSGHARVAAEFPYFIERTAPVSRESGLLDVDCRFEVADDKGVVEHWLEVAAPVTTLCPCSRDISDYGAHNQRTVVTVRVQCALDEAGLPSIVWIEELVEVAEAAGSAPVFPVVKRLDERHLTMSAFDKPRFVEDVTREVAAVLADDDRIVRFSVRAESHESIHSHNAFATIHRQS